MGGRTKENPPDIPPLPKGIVRNLCNSPLFEKEGAEGDLE